MSTVSMEETKGKFKLEGKVAGIKNDNAYKEGFTSTDKPYKALSFFVQTSPTNRVKVEAFAMEWDEVTAYSQKDKKSKKVKWSKRHDNHGDYKVMGQNLFLEKGKDGKNQRKVLVEWDAFDYIKANLKDGDSVRVTGNPDYQNYENDEGQKKESVKFAFRSISKIDDIDFESEDFKEVSMFEQEIVATDVMVDDETKKLLIGAQTITYKGKDTATATFVVDGEKLPKLANNMARRLEFGDFIKVFGLIVNASVLEEAESNDELADDDDDWGGDNEVQDNMNTQYITTFVSEMQVTSVDSQSYESKKYKEEDFFSQDQKTFDGEIDEDDDFGDDSDSDEIDDLPFG